MVTNNRIRLAQAEYVPERPFANPERSLFDLAVLEYMRAQLQATLREVEFGSSDPHARGLYIHTIKEDGDREHRQVILSRQQLLGANTLAVVGFFGQKRGTADPSVLGDVDTDLLEEFVRHTYVLSYNSLELPDGNWANLVLMLDASGIEHWRASQKHAYAARELSPLFYETIRLHNGALPGGLDSRGIVLLSTKYYDYRGDAWWQAIREFSY